MFVTVITVRQGEASVRQIEAPTVKDCLVSWAGHVEVPGLTDEGRTRLRGDMADFDEPSTRPLAHVWKLKSDLGVVGGEHATVIVVETVRR